MDSITQAALGAAIGQGIAGKDLGSRKAIITGAVLATIPDLDVLLYLFYDKLEMLSIHRGLSHSLFFLTLETGLLYLIMRRWKTFAKLRSIKLVSFIFLALVTHVLLDALTAFGTQLLLPFSSTRVSWDSINVVDPVYTLLLLLGTLGSLFIKKGKINLNALGLLLSSCYLLFTLINKSFVHDHIASIANSKFEKVENITTIPVGVANKKWYGIISSTEKIGLMLYDAFTHEYSEITTFPIHEEYFEEIDDQLASTMRWFAKDNYTLDKQGDTLMIYNLQVDMRGISMQDGQLVPTKGYFTVTKKGEGYEFGSGSWE